MVVIAGVLGMTFYVAPWIKRTSGTSRVDCGREEVKEYGQAIPQWQAEHPGRSCPGALGELSKYTRYRDTRDPWGDALGMVCAPEGIVVYSLGGDGLLGTRDDLWSAR